MCAKKVKRIKALMQKTTGVLLQALPIPKRIWIDISMDFITGLPVVKNKSVIVVAMDRLSKYYHRSGFVHSRLHSGNNGRNFHISGTEFTRISSDVKSG